MLITVNCKDVPAIKSPLAVYVSDQIAAVPALKLHEFVLSPIDDEMIDINKTVTAIKNFLISIGEEKNFAVIAKNNTISITSLNGKILDQDLTTANEQFFSCTHCGHVTRYESVHNNHLKIHYL